MHTYVLLVIKSLETENEVLGLPHVCSTLAWECRVDEPPLRSRRHPKGKHRHMLALWHLGFFSCQIRGSVWCCRLLEQCCIAPVRSQTIHWDSILILFFWNLDEIANLSNINGGQGNFLSHRHTALTSLCCISGCIYFEFAAQF